MSLPIPQPPGVPLLGNIFDVDPSNTWESLRKLAERYGEIFQIRVLGHTIVFVAGAALAEELCDERRFRKYVGGPIVEIRYAVHDALFTAFDHEPIWGVAHRIIAPRLAPAALAPRLPQMRAVAVELVAKWRGLAAAAPVRLFDELNRLCLEATALTLFGVKLGCLAGPEHPMLGAIDGATAEAMRRPTRPALLNWLWYGRKFAAATATMRGFAEEMVAARRADPAAGRVPGADDGDLLDALLGTADPQTGAALTPSQVVDEVVSMPIGSATSPALLSAAVYFLLRNPGAAARARAELDAVVGAAREPVAYEHLARLEYLEGVVRESLRLSFAAPGFNIEPVPRAGGDRAPVLLGGGKYQIAHDQPLIIVLAGVNRDPTVFEDPLAFRPERMMGKAFEALPRGVKKWFGNGKRECIGKHWAWQWMMTTLATLLREVDFEMADPSYTLKQDGWFCVKPVDFWVKVKPREG
ncbi:cytochrome P450 [Durotheca rogersii]|uniref:cytochrome P450 n=1 Tax=Durotheca rogersii TaxID=419775 RepID=UPI00221FDD86|nr:cytochrome P450 [Durotheca rogersii]KAI5867883.1 cytochrome P450 [Durotheca rogersii]